MEIQTFPIVGMTCEHCRQAVSEQLSKLDGVSDVQVNLAAGTATVASEQPLRIGDVAAAVDEAGYELQR
jgi:copper chaperone